MDTGTLAPAITATGLSRAYGHRDDAVLAVRDVDLVIDSGTLTVLVGPSGAGTSTLLHCLCGADRGTTGRVVRHSARVPSGPHGLRTRLRPARVVVVGEGPVETTPQRSAHGIARARPPGSRPDIIVSDEPTAHLDATSAAAMVEALCAVRDRLGVTVLVATSDPLLVERADRVVVMSAGRVVAQRAGPTTVLPEGRAGAAGRNPRPDHHEHRRDRSQP